MAKNQKWNQKIKKAMKKIYIFSLILLMSVFTALPQQTPDYSVLFKMQLFMELPVTFYSNDIVKDVVKTDSLFMVINRNMKVTMHPLKTEGFSNRYLFFEVDLARDIEYIDRLQPYSIWLAFGCMSVYRFVIDTQQFILYRLIGFEDSDFFSFLEKLQFSMNHLFRRQVPTREFFKYHKVEGIDFKCLDRGLRDRRRFNNIKYPCLFRVTAPVGLPCPELP